jgi:predicted nuclease of predicted toxin-antitoxin system
VRLLFDENLSHRLVETLSDVFPDSEHVRNVGLASADDIDVARYAVANDLVIVTKDVDFEEIGLGGMPPVRVIRIAIGNSTTSEIERVLRSVAAALEDSMSTTSRLVIVSSANPASE